MRTTAKAVLAILIIFLLTGCGTIDNYDTVAEKTERVVVMRPYELINQEAGGTIRPEPMKPGKWSHGAGPCLAYDFNMTIMTVKRDMEVKMRENINMGFRVSCTYQLIAGRTVDAALNFMPHKGYKKEDGNAQGTPVAGSGYYTIGIGNSIQVVDVPEEEIFNNNILPYFEMAARDIIDSRYSMNIEPGRLGEEIKVYLEEILASNKQPRVVLGNDNRPRFDPSKTITVTDVVRIIAVTVEDYKNPDVVDKKIKEIEIRKAKVGELRQALAQMEIVKKMRETEARQLQLIAVNTKKALHQNPQMRGFQKFRAIREGIRNGEVSNTKVIVIPESMSDRITILEGGRPSGQETAKAK